MEDLYISEELKKVPATQYDVEKLSHKIDRIFSKIDRLNDSKTCVYHAERMDKFENRITWIEKKIYMGIGGLAVLQICIAVILAVLG